MPADVVMAVEMGGEASHERAKCVDLIAELDPRLVRVDARRGRARVADEAALAVHERRHAARIGRGRAEREVQVKARRRAGALRRPTAPGAMGR